MDLPILKYVDVLIGLSVVMIIVSTVVLAITQAMLSVSRARARHLSAGVERLLVQIDSTGFAEHAPYLARLILRHPLVGRETIGARIYDMFRGLRKADVTEGPLPPSSPTVVVQRDEVAFILIELAADEGPLAGLGGSLAAAQRLRAAQQAVINTLARNGIEDPRGQLRAIRLRALEIEKAKPGRDTALARTDAVVECATSEFIAKLHQTFDNTIARISDAFAVESRIWVGAAALVVALALNLDGFKLLKRISVDDHYRAALIQRAEEMKKTPPNSTQGPNAAVALELSDEDKNLLQPAVAFPDHLIRPTPESIPGILFSWLLLSLGAPFWYDQLKNLLKLRSLLAKKDDSDREHRQGAKGATETAKETNRTSPSPATSTVVGDEAGDLAATGGVG